MRQEPDNGQLESYTADSLLFAYRYEYHAGSGIADGDYEETVLFAVPSSDSGFTIDSLHPGKVYFRNACFGFCGNHVVVQALIQGDRLSERSFRVEGVVIYQYDPDWSDSTTTAAMRDTIRFSGRFLRTGKVPEL